jgi:hypothetical protein
MTRLEEIAAACAPIVLRDPLAELLGFKADGRMEFTLEDAGRYAGHLCPTVATAFELGREGLKRLYGDQLPVRGDVSVKVHSAPDVFASGPVGRIVGYITGAAGNDGFRGLAGRFARAGLLRYEPEAAPFGAVTLWRSDTRASVCLVTRAGVLPEQPVISENLRPALAGDPRALAVFRQAWAERVAAVIEAGPRLFDVVPSVSAQHQPQHQ